VKGYVKAIILTLVFLAVLIPFASTAPDGLEKVAETLGVKEHEPTWTGLMPGYTVPIIQDPYLSTFLSGVLGTLLVLGVGFLVGIAATRRDR